MATEQVYEALLDIDSNLAIVPQLALDWNPLDPTTWEFELRPDVTFHDGTPFTAGDVVFSIECARAKTSDLRDYLDGVAGLEAVGDHTVRITTAAPDPSLWLKLADVAIMSRAWAERHGVTTPADYNRAREENYALRHANGTGPFMVEAFEPRGRHVLVRNPAWWARPTTRTASTALCTFPEKAMPRNSPPCSRARSIYSWRRRTRPWTRSAAPRA